MKQPVDSSRPHLASRKPLGLALLCGAFLVTAAVQAAEFPQWGELAPGAHAVGFKTVFQYDLSRHVKPKHDHRGQASPEETARFMQISLWYPARNDAGAARMPYEDYIYLTPQEATTLADGKLYMRTQAVNAEMLPEQRRARGRQGFRGLVALLAGRSVSDDEIDRALSVETAAIRDAEPAEGSFPVILYGLGATARNTVLAEYLASHGYIVITCPDVGANSYVNNGGGHFMATEIQVNDLEYLVGFAHGAAGADTGRLGMIAYNFSGPAQVVFQLRHMAAGALVSLQGWEAMGVGVEIVERSPYQDLTRVRAPFLYVAGSIGPPEDLRLIDSLRYSDRYELRFPGRHQDDLLANRIVAGIASREQRQAYELMSRHVRSFFDAYLKNDSDELAALKKGTASQTATLRHTPGLPPVPTQEELWNMLWDEGGIHEVKKIYQAFKKREPERHLFREPMLNLAGYRIMGLGRLEEAIEILELNVEAYPESANVYDSLGEAYAAAGKRDLAIASYEKSLELDPENQNAVQMISSLKSQD